ncbi:MAG: BCCT family transporter [Lachnospiraceae bacterium]|nr:BCCT family transporter [Lachnospiraceae bacterium]
MTKKFNAVFKISFIIVIAITAWCILLPENFEAFANLAFGVLTGKFGWFYTISVSGFLIFSLAICFSKYGKIRLGGDDSKPEYSNISWFAMLFSAGMGIGLIFWGVAEPLNHYMNPLGADPGTVEAAEFAIQKSFLHWSLHPWACFAITGLALAYMQFRKGKSGLISNIFIPLLGEERVNGPIGKAIDILAVFATIAGVCTSLGLGTMQINSGLNYLFGIPENKIVQVIIILIVSVLFMASAASGINKGIKILSNTNILLACILCIAAFIIGPTLDSLNFFTEGIGNYIRNLPSESLAVGAFENGEWYGGWTIFYWAWWIAWAPFVGSFIARISKGRTVREFVVGVLIVPSLLSFIWFAVFGSMGIHAGTEVAAKAIEVTSTACFVVYGQYPFGAVLSGLTLLLVCTFFVTSADSATFVLGMLTSDGDMNPKTSVKLIWGVMESLLAIVLLVGSSNGLQMMQNISIVGAFPFAFVMIGSMFALYKSFKEEKLDDSAGNLAQKAKTVIKKEDGQLGGYQNEKEITIHS